MKEIRIDFETYQKELTDACYDGARIRNDLLYVLEKNVPIIMEHNELSKQRDAYKAIMQAIDLIKYYGKNKTEIKVKP